MIPLTNSEAERERQAKALDRQANTDLQRIWKRLGITPQEFVGSKNTATTTVES